MEIIIKGEAKEIAALILEIRGRQKLFSVGGTGNAVSQRDQNALANAIRNVLLGSSAAENQAQQPEPTEHTRHQGEVSQTEEPAP